MDGFRDDDGKASHGEPEKIPTNRLDKKRIEREREEEELRGKSSGERCDYVAATWTVFHASLPLPFSSLLQIGSTLGWWF